MKEEIELDFIQKILSGEEIQSIQNDVSKFSGAYIISNKIIKKDLVFSNGTGIGILFQNCLFEESVRFEAKEFKSSIVANDCQFIKAISFGEGVYSGHIEITGKIEESIFLNGGNYKRIELDCNCKALSIGNCKVDGLFIQGSAKEKIKIITSNSMVLVSMVIYFYLKL